MFGLDRNLKKRRNIEIENCTITRADFTFLIQQFDYEQNVSEFKKLMAETDVGSNKLKL